MRKFYGYLAMMLVFCGCFSSSNFHTSKEEITLKTTALKTGEIISYLGEKNGLDYLVFSSKITLKSATIDENPAQISQDFDFELPYKSEFINSYILSTKASANKSIKFCFSLAMSTQETCVNITKEYKSLNYHLAR